MSTQLPDHYDVLIIGGGLAGMTCALHCLKHSPSARIAIIEKRSHPVPEAAHKIGESSVEAGAYYLSKYLDLEEHLENDQILKKGLRLFLPSGDNSDISERLEIGGKDYPPMDSYQFDRGRLENYLSKLCSEKGVAFIDSARVLDVDIKKGKEDHKIRYEREKEESSITSRWVVDSSGRAGFLKRKLGLKKDCDHNNSSAWFRIETRINVDDWCDDPKWHEGYGPDNPRWHSTNHLLGEGYWVWLIPLSSGSTSIGIVADEEYHPLSDYNSLEKTLAWLDKHEPACAKQVRMHESSIQDFSAIKHYSMECEKLYSTDRWGIVGDAGFFIDPFYSPGNDFIALANTFVCRLIERDLKGQSITLHTPLFNKLFRLYFDGTSHVFRNQYQLFGHHQAMPVKILWDWMAYWSLTAFFVCHERVADPMAYFRNMFRLKRMNELNQNMQRILREWATSTPREEISGRHHIETGMVEVLINHNRSLGDKFTNKEFDARFEHNIAQMETLFWEIVDHMGTEVKVPFKRRSHPSARKNGFQHVFEESKIDQAGMPTSPPMAEEPTTAMA